MTNFKKQTNILFRRMLFLLTLMLVGSVGVSWAQTSYGKAEINAAPTSATEWQTIKYEDGFRAWYNGTPGDDENYGGVEISGKWFVKLTDSGYFEIRFPHGNVVAGDIVRVEVAKYYNNSENTTLGYKVNGSNGVVDLNVSDRESHFIDYTLKEADINSSSYDSGYDYIQIYRSPNTYGACAYHSVELLKVQRYSVTLGMKDATTGCDAWFTLGDDATQHRGTVNDIAAGTKVVFHGSDAGADHSLMNGWRTAGTTGSEGWLNWGATYTVNSLDANLNYEAEFWSAYRIFANAENGATATVYTNTSTKENISGRKHHDNITETLYFETTVPDGYTFDGWYNGSQKISSANPYGYGQYTSQNGTTDLTLTAKFTLAPHPANITCVNNTIDLSKITVGWGGATYDPSSHAGSITDNWGAISVKFASAIDLHELNTLTLAGTNVEKTDNAGAFNCVNFVCEGGEVAEYNYPFSVSNKSAEDKEKLKKVTAIELKGDDGTNNHKGNFTLTAITLNFGGSHTKPSTPTLINGTKDGMVIGAGCPFTLSASNGYWREYKSDYSGEKDGGLISDVYAPTHTFESGLPAGDHYFGIQDYIGHACDFGVQHRSDLTRAHVKVVEATPNVTCQSTTIDKSKLYVYGDATYDGSTGQFVVNNYNTYGNGLKIVFASPQDLSYAKKITINGAEFKNPNMTEAGDSETRWPISVAEGGKTVINLNNKGNANYDAVTEIDLRDIQAGTYTISSIDIEFDHTPAKPELVNGTTATMVLPVGKTLKLSANNADDTFWREYTAISGTQKYDRIPASEYNTPVREISGLTQGTYYFAAERRRTCEFGHTHYSPEITWVTVEVEPVGTIPNELALIKQPIFGQNHTGMAKEYIAIAKLQASNGDAVQGWGVTSVTGTEYKKTTDDKSSLTDEEKRKIAYVLGSHEYKVTAENGLCISQWGRAGLIEGQAALPTRATLMLKAAGTMDFFILANNLTQKVGDDSNSDRRHIKVWYTNDQNVDANGDRILMPFKCANDNTNNDFWFNGERLEDNSNGLTPLQVSVRLQHLGSDGTCNVFITYEDDVKDENVWIKGILVKRPDLKVTIGRTDKLRYTNGNYNNKNCELTPYGENQPYQWNFGTAGFYAKDPSKSGEVATDEKKKVNEYDGRTYICGVGPNGEQLMDHLLVYSDGYGETKESKANFDGRKITNGRHTGYESDESDNNEHIEFLHPTKYSGQNAYGETQNGFDTDRRSFRPILSNGLKVNVTGSGWFTIACAAPNGAVKMKVLSSTNYGTSYINLLREFDVPKSSSDTDWQTYRVYLKAHNDKNGDEGFWHGSDNVVKAQLADYSEVEITDPEEYQMSLYVVFDAIGEESNYYEGKAQLNIHFMQWINELPADYVFQQEEDPKLLSTLQHIKGNGTDEKPDLYWQAGTSLVEEQKTITPTYSDGSGTHSAVTYPSAYNSAGYQDRESGERSEEVYITSSRDDLACEWNVAAYAHSAAHTEVAYKNGGKNYGNNTTNVYSTDQANGETSDPNLEFAIPISGSFFRFMPMKNEFISAWIVPAPDMDGVNEKTETIYVLDETGKPIPYIQGADMQEANKSDVTADARIHGWVKNISAGLATSGSTAVFTTQKNGGKTAAVRIDFAALAGKEYFIVSDNGTISLSRLNVTGNEALARMEEVAAALTLNNDNDATGTTNTAAINASMNGTGRYLSESQPVTLNRAFEKNTWASLILPFSMNEKKFEEVFGTGAQCVHFTDLDINRNVVKLTHHFYNMVVAGRPVFVKPTVNVEAGTRISDVTLQTNTVVPTSTSHDGCTFTFTGSYDNSNMADGATENDTKCALFISRNEFKYTKKHKSIKALRTWIDTEGWDPVPVNTSMSAPVMMMLNFDDEDVENATGIEALIAEEYGQNVIVVTKSTKVYDINGRVVANGTDISNLPSGVYIVNGKKYVK